MSEAFLAREGVARSSAAFLWLRRSHGDAMALRLTDVSVPGGVVCHALIDGGCPALLVPLSSEDVAVSDEGSRGVRLSVRQFRVEGRDRRYAVLCCVEPSVLSTFAVFCDDVLTALVGATAGEVAVTCRRTLTDWQRLFAAQPDDGLGRNALAGLLAELHVLEACAQRGGTTLDYWHGPENRRHDFTSELGAVEVKATATADKFVVEIHGLRQLEPPAIGDLHLYVERFEALEHGGDSVPDAVERLVNAGVAALPLHTKLAALGYSSADAEDYRLVRFQTLETRAYRVERSFPALTAGNVTEHLILETVVNVRYGLDLQSSSVDTYREDNEAFLEILVP